MTTDTGLPDEAAEPAETAAEAIESTEAEQAQRAQAAARRVRRRRNALRWLGATVVTLAIGGGTAFALTLPQRTDLPGLGTAPDGRYEFPALTLPTLPPGQPAPTASESADDRQHLADIRKLLLPRPVGATPQDPKSAAAGWLTDPASLFIDQDTKQIFAEYGLRHGAVESWKTGDGATTTIDLLQFSDAKAAAGAQFALSNANVTPNDVAALTASLTGVPGDAQPRDLSILSSGTNGDYTTATGGGKLTRYGSFESGDVIAVVSQSGPTNLPFTPFQQVLTLQAQLLQ